MCGSTKLIAISKIERNLLNQLEFTCSQDGCDEAVKYENYNAHLTKLCNFKIEVDVLEDARLDKIYNETINP